MGETRGLRLYDYDEFGRVGEEKHTKDGATSRWITRVLDEFSRETHVEDRASGIIHDYDYALGSTKESTDTAAYGSVTCASVSDGSGRETTHSATFSLLGSQTHMLSRVLDWDTTTDLPKTSAVTITDPETSTATALTMSYGFDVADKLTTMTAGPWKSGGVFVSHNATGTASKVSDRVSIPFGAKVSPLWYFQCEMKIAME